MKPKKQERQYQLPVKCEGKKMHFHAHEYLRNAALNARVSRHAHAARKHLRVQRGFKSLLQRRSISCDVMQNISPRSDLLALAVIQSCVHINTLLQMHEPDARKTRPDPPLFPRQRYIGCTDASFYDTWFKLFVFSSMPWSFNRTVMQWQMHQFLTYLNIRNVLYIYSG